VTFDGLLKVLAVEGRNLPAGLLGVRAGIEHRYTGVWVVVGCQRN
jgi:hypothetical protein